MGDFGAMERLLDDQIGGLEPARDIAQLVMNLTLQIARPLGMKIDRIGGAGRRRG